MGRPSILPHVLLEDHPSCNSKLSSSAGLLLVINLPWTAASHRCCFPAWRQRRSAIFLTMGRNMPLTCFASKYATGPLRRSLYLLSCTQGVLDIYDWLPVASVTVLLWDMALTADSEVSCKSLLENYQSLTYNYSACCRSLEYGE